MPGWNENIENIRDYEKLPANAKTYIERIQKYLNIPGECLPNFCSCLSQVMC